MVNSGSQHAQPVGSRKKSARAPVEDVNPSACALNSVPQSWGDSHAPLTRQHDRMATINILGNPSPDETRMTAGAVRLGENVKDMLGSCFVISYCPAILRHGPDYLANLSQDSL
jgi:hypothetical protein